MVLRLKLLFRSAMKFREWSGCQRQSGHVMTSDFTIKFQFPIFFGTITGIFVKIRRLFLDNFYIFSGSLRILSIGSFIRLTNKTFRTCFRNGYGQWGHSNFRFTGTMDQQRTIIYHTASYRNDAVINRYYGLIYRCARTSAYRLNDSAGYGT